MNAYAPSQLIRVLLVDDDPGDVRLTMEALRDSKLRTSIDVVRNGVEAMAFLRQEGAYAGSTPPDLILLDLNMPLKDGRETLAEIKADSKLRTIPVVILTTSEAEQDIAQTYALGANCYIAKPVNLPQFIKIVLSIEEFWFTVVKLPGR